ncbi:transcription factor KUA1-like [Punica granatum]|uniref:Transcription factor KUA1-like n=1 Tax=Punica granatum TaxID=22663 RepID=A0A218Y0W1_PUNGR|nr:transcription factor KUA1-like [Punica granatum]OWM90700.1 hypothetical protein CDL15_Pgr021005 [Punica granatum]
MDSGGEGSISGKDQAVDAPSVANGGMTLDHFLDINLDEILDGHAVNEFLDDLDKWLLVPEAVPEGPTDHGQSAIIPAPGEAEAGQKRKRKEAVGELVERQKPERKKAVSWTEDERRIFMFGYDLYKTSTEKWKEISTPMLPNTTEIASHAQKYPERRERRRQDRQRKSINDTVVREEDWIDLVPSIQEKHDVQKRSNCPKQPPQWLSPISASFIKSQDCPFLDRCNPGFIRCL